MDEDLITDADANANVDAFMLHFRRAIANVTLLLSGLIPLSNSDKLPLLKMGTEPIQNLVIATSLSLSLSLSGNSPKELIVTQFFRYRCVETKH